MSDETNGPRIYKLTDRGLTTLEFRIEKLAKRARRLGFPEPTVSVVDTIEEKVVDPILGETGEVVRRSLVTVQGESPQIDGWRLAAVVDRDPETPVGEPYVVSAVPGETVDPAWKFVGDICDHCATKDGKYVARGRRKIVALRDADDAAKLVGLTCVVDFLGTSSPAGLAAWAECLVGLDELAEGIEEEDRDYVGGGGERRFSPEFYLGWVAATIRTDGWVSRGNAREGRRATADVAAEKIHDSRIRKTGRYGQPVVSDEEHPTDVDVELAEAALDWARALPIENGNDYLDNVRAVSAKYGWSHRDLGLGASILSAFGREVERWTTAVAKAERIASGAAAPCPTGKQTIVGTVTKIDTKANDFGTRLVMTVLDDRGFSVWGTLPAALEGRWDYDDPQGPTFKGEANVGSRVTFSATIERSDRDESFGFYKRPTKAALLDVEAPAGPAS